MLFNFHFNAFLLTSNFHVMTILIAILLHLGIIFAPEEATPELLVQYEWLVIEDEGLN
jgi:hypothetical protein